ncbi:MAG: response regulator [Spirochaetaceae bacterium]
MSDDNQGLILVVDDERRNRDLLSSLLQMNNYQVIEAVNGIQAIKKAHEKNPDVILLDVMMPEMNGFEACKILKKDPETAPIPVIMVSAFSDHENLIKGIEAGANEFLTKPIDKVEVNLRVKNAVYAKHLHDEVKTNFIKLKEITLLKDSLTHMIIHDLRQPITSINCYLEYFEQKIEDQGIVQMATFSRAILNSLIEMISSLLDIEKMEDEKLELNICNCDLLTLIQKSVDSLQPLAIDHQIMINSNEKKINISCDKDLIFRVMNNLIGNAIKYTKEDGNVRITIENIDGSHRVEVTDEGSGIPTEFHDKVFEKFGQVKIDGENKQYSTGLGLTFCKMVIEAHNGEIGLISEPDKGSTFWFVLPKVL